jgi:tetratricopeptide (TPR) repeat protein
MTSRSIAILFAALPPAFLASHPAIGDEPFDPASVKDLYRHCIGVAEETRKKFPDMVKPIFDLGMVHKRFGLDDDAVRCFREGLSIEPAHPEVLAEIAFLYSQRINEPAILEEALASCRKALAIAPNYPGIQTRIGMILSHVGGKENIEAAIDAYRAEIQNRSAEPTTYIMLGKALRDLGLLRESIIAYREANRIAPMDTGPLYQIAQVYRSLAKEAADKSDENGVSRLRVLEQEVLAKYNELKKAEENPDDGKKGDNLGNQLIWTAQCYLDAAQTYLQKDMLEESARSLRAALACQPKAHPIRKILIDIYRKAGMIDRALSECRVTVAEDRSPELLFLFAGLCTEKKQFAEAASLLEEVIAKDPDRGEAFCELARIILSGNVAGTPEHALELATQAIGKPPLTGGAPEIASRYSVLSWAFDRTGDRGKAIAALRTAVELDPSNPGHQAKLYKLQQRETGQRR